MSHQQVLEVFAETERFTSIPDLYKNKELLRSLSKSNVLFAAKVGVSSYLAQLLGELSKQNGYTGSVRLCSLAKLGSAIRNREATASRAIFIVEIARSDSQIDKPLESLLIRAQKKNAVVWLISFLSNIDRRVLKKFNAFFAFPSSQAEMDILSDILPVPQATIRALTNSSDKLLFFSETKINDLMGSSLTNPCLIELPQELSSGIALLPSVSAELLYEDIPSGPISRYYSRDNVSPLVFHLRNFTLEPCSVRLACWFEGVGKTSTSVVTLAVGESTSFSMPMPNLDIRSRVTETRLITLKVRAKHGLDRSPTILFDTSFEVKLLPFKALRWAVPKDHTRDTFLDLSHHIAAFVTPNSPEVIEILAEANRTYTALNWSLVGTNQDKAPLLKKIEALYNTFLKKKIRYDSLPLPLGPSPSNISGYQLVRLPSQTLRERQGNCVDLSVLFASVLERAQISPLIVVMHQHAFVGWKYKVTDSVEIRSHLDFLDVVLLADAVGFAKADNGVQLTFDVARVSANNQYETIIEGGWLNHDWKNKQGFARIVDISQYRYAKSLVSILPLEP